MGHPRRARAPCNRGLTSLHPDCNHLDELAQHLGRLGAGDPMLKPVYRHRVVAAAGVR